MKSKNGNVIAAGVTHYVTLTLKKIASSPSGKQQQQAANTDITMYVGAVANCVNNKIIFFGMI